ncbi:MAG: hypothetical protein PHE24_06675 [Patescibacteria group bacterium]|nr:hypothetical protein [Patescibacteria group bacterium]
MGIENFPTSEPKSKNKGKMNPVKAFAAGAMIMAGGIVAGLKAETPVSDIAKKGKADSTQVTPAKQSHGRIEPGPIAFSQPPTETKEASDIDAMLAAESSKSTYSVRGKGPSTEKVLGYGDAQKEGTIYQTAVGKKDEVNREYNQLKKEHKQEKKTVISFVDKN